jgi:tRNA threonylcarbamoyladenosine biosynthesis protein TsaB
MLVLAIDASTYSGSVALVRDHTLVAQAEAAMRGENEERLMPAIASLLAGQRVAVDRLDAVACGSGPGSFTSLRIAASIAKGICAARQIPLVVAPSTLLVIAAATHQLGPGRYIAALDAMRGDVFCQLVDILPSKALAPGHSWRASRADLLVRAGEAGARVVGPKESPPMDPHARGFARLLELGLTELVELTSWEPNYGRKAEAQVRWEAAHGRALDA